MNRRERARLEKRKRRERRLREEKHLASSGAAKDTDSSAEPDVEQPPDEFGALFDAADDVDADSDADADADADADTEADADADLGDDAGDSIGGDAAAGPRGRAPGFESFQAERALRAIARRVEGREFQSEDERSAFLRSFVGRTPEQVEADGEDDPTERAQDLALQAMQTPDRRRAEKLARQALALDPKCTDARSLLAVIAWHGRSERIRLLSATVDDAAAALGGEEFFAQHPGEVGGDVFARPYLRARRTLADFLRSAGRDADARAHYEALLALDNADRSRVRHVLLGMSLERGDLPAARELLARFEIDGESVMLWGRVLERFLSGERRAASALLRRERARQPLVEELLQKRQRSVDVDDPDASTEESVAAFVHVHLGGAWHRHTSARRWLAEGGPATTEAERAAALAGLDPRVAPLLKLGEPRPGGLGEWLDYPARFGFGAGDVPALLAMVEDPALNEMDSRTPAVWASLHAWRALGQLAARGVESAAAVADPLLRIMRDDDDDDWARDDCVAVAALIGAPCLPAVRAVAEDERASDIARMTAIEALQELGQSHPDLRPELIPVLVNLLRRSVGRVELGEDSEDENNPYAGDDDDIEGDFDAEPLFGDASLNGRLVSALCELGVGRGADARMISDLVRRAFEAGIVDEQWAGDWEAVRHKLQARPAGGETEPRA